MGRGTGGCAARNSQARPHGSTSPATDRPKDPLAATSIAAQRAQSGSVEPSQRLRDRDARMFVPFRPRSPLSYEHVFCSTRTSTLAQRAREALSLTRAFLLLEDDDPVDWEVGREERAATSYEPAWAHAHRATLGPKRTPRRGGQPAPPPQVCLSPIGGEGGHDEAGRLKIVGRGGTQRWPISDRSRITTGSSRAAIDS